MCIRDRRMLEARGLGVDTASSGHEALDFLKANSPDVIFMDFMMPDMDGYEVTGMITANPRTSTIPVVMCTGHDTPQDRLRAKENGASAFVTKPVDDAALDGLLAELNGRLTTRLAAPLESAIQVDEATAAPDHPARTAALPEMPAAMPHVTPAPTPAPFASAAPLPAPASALAATPAPANTAPPVGAGVSGDDVARIAE